MPTGVTVEEDEFVVTAVDDVGQRQRARSGDLRHPGHPRRRGRGWPAAVLHRGDVDRPGRSGRAARRAGRLQARERHAGVGVPGRDGVELNPLAGQWVTSAPRCSSWSPRARRWLSSRPPTAPSPMSTKNTSTASPSDEATAQLTGMVAGLEETGISSGRCVFGRLGRRHRLDQAGAGVGDFTHVSAPEEPETALARGAALASANAPLFASSTAALAYAQDPGTGAVDPLRPARISQCQRCFPPVTTSVTTTSPTALWRTRTPTRLTVVIDTPVRRTTANRVAGRSCCSAAGWRWPASARWWRWRSRWRSASAPRSRCSPTPSQNLIVPAQQAPAPPNPEASVAQPKIEAPVTDGGAQAVEPASTGAPARSSAAAGSGGSGRASSRGGPAGASCRRRSAPAHHGRPAARWQPQP